MSRYIKTLKECSKIAESEYREVSIKLKKTKNKLSNFQKNLVDTIQKLDESDINDKSVYYSVYEVNNKTSEL